MNSAPAVTSRTTLEADIRRYLLGRIVLAGVGFVSIPLINRGVGVDNYGLISLWTTLACWVPLVVAGWLQQSTLRYHRLYAAMEGGQDYRRTVHAAAWLLAGVTTAVTGAAMQVAWRLSWQEILLTALLAGVTVFHMVFSAIAQAELKAPTVIVADLLRTVVPILLFGAHYAVAHAVGRTTTLLYFLAGMTLAAAYLQSSARAPDDKHGQALPEVARRMFLFGLPMGIWFGMYTGQMLIGRLVLQRLHLSAALGLFTTYQDFFAKTGTVLFMPVTYALHGQVMALWADRDRQGARSAIRRGYLYQIALGLALAAGAILFHGPLTAILFGPQVRSDAAGAAALLLMLGVVANNLGLVSHKGMELGERTGSMAALMGASALINGALSFWLAQRWGVVGVAASLLAANLFYLAATHCYSAVILRTTDGFDPQARDRRKRVKLDYRAEPAGQRDVAA